MFSIIAISAVDVPSANQVPPHLSPIDGVVGLIVAGVNYHAYVQREQEADGGILDNSPLVDYVECKVTHGDTLFGLLSYDVIGHWSKKISNNK